MSAVKAFLFIVYRYFEAITRKKTSFDRYRKIELALEGRPGVGETPPGPTDETQCRNVDRRPAYP